ncbi:NADP-dependent oxidoreductase domain-containing protein [Xylariomycetidae sp. FL0641]|nr:NADP-dependent oxidoreductase domain-containing protein [Xylariomycetidae sp. FL0641]
MPYKLMGKEVGNIGFGMMSLTLPNARASEEEKIAILKTALEAGANCWNGGELYGTSLQDNSLALLNRYFQKYPEDAERVNINIKGGCRWPREVDNSPEYTAQSISNCLELLGDKGRIDMWEMARRATQAEYIASLRTINEFAEKGKIGGLALSEVGTAMLEAVFGVYINSNTIRQASKIRKVEGVEIELSLFFTEALTNGVCEACAELDIPIFAYSPLGRGILTGKVQNLDDLNPVMKLFPRFHADNFKANLKLVEQVKDWAAKKGCTPGQFAINWVAALSRQPGMPKIIPIPGAGSLERVKENCVEVNLTDADMAEVSEFLKTFKTAGARIPEQFSMWNDKTDTTDI